MSTHLPASSSFFQTAPRLPLELIHLILTHLSPSSDKPTLSACTLVHPSWSTYARRLLFSHVRLDALTMPTRPHDEFTHINMPDFGSFLAFMRDNPLLAGSLTELEVTGFVRDCWKEMPSAIEGLGVDGDNINGVGNGEELDVYDEFEWEWDWDAQRLLDAPSSCRWTKLPLTFLYSILGIGTARLFPRLQYLSLNSLFIEWGALPYGGLPMSLENLVLREVGTTANSTRALLHLLNAFNPSTLTLDFLPTSDSPSPHLLLSGPSTTDLASILTSSRTTSLAISGTPDASNLLEIIKLAPLFTANITKLKIHVRQACEVSALANLLKTGVGRQLRELSLDLKPACYLSKPEVHIDHATYLTLSHTLTLFPCPSLQQFTLHLLSSFSYSGTTTALDCAPHLLGTLPRGVREVVLVVDFPFVVQAAAVNVDWSAVVWALVRVCGGRGGASGNSSIGGSSLAGGGRGSAGGKVDSGKGGAGKRATTERTALVGRGVVGGGGVGDVRVVRLVVQNDGARIEEEERRGVEGLFEEKFWLVGDVLRVEFDP